MVTMPPCHGARCGFDSRWLRKYHNPIKSVEDEETNTSVVLMILNGYVAQLVRVPVCQAGCRGFESHRSRKIW